MSWSLELRNGDLTIGGARLGIVTGEYKLVQDFRCALLEAMGTDESHPWFGSLIDGGVQDGIPVPSLIGTDDWQETAVAIEAEVRRIGRQIQNQQQRRLEDDRFTYGRPTLTGAEILLGVSSIRFYQAQDKMLVRVTLTTGTNETATIDVPVGPNV